MSLEEEEYDGANNEEGFESDYIEWRQPRYDFFAMTEGMRKLILDKTLDLEARHLYDESRITHLTADLRRTEGHLTQLNDYLDGEGIVVDWEDDEGEAGTS
ncbi:hypothetical protein GIB67_022835 [Kingdonia uniflora]|uniref:Uncharacterized protein n=1 Tax=Kingdonia uniflora TaxID=39325 RepID=A0A7J7P7N9_9MAGN|nr:hypothetical protein GIB67_022835 [Kingdonia uniflora]